MHVSILPIKGDILLPTYTTTILKGWVYTKWSSHVNQTKSYVLLTDFRISQFSS